MPGDRGNGVMVSFLEIFGSACAKQPKYLGETVSQPTVNFELLEIDFRSQESSVAAESQT